MQKIESAQNDTYKKLLSLTTAKGLKREGLFLLSGEKIIKEFFAKPHLGIAYEITTARLKPRHQAAKQLQLSAELFAALDVLGTHFNLLVLKQPEIAVVKDDMAAYKPKGIEVVLPVGDPGNLGALLRSCEAFSVPRVILTQEAAHPFLPKSVKASAGSVLRLPLARGPSLNAFPQSCMALDMDGTPIADFTWPKNGLLVVGEEGPGLRQAKFRSRIAIPTKGVQSLNAMVAASIALAWKASLT